MYKMLEEKSIQLQLNLDLEHSNHRNIFEQADWLNTKKAGSLLGIEEYVRIQSEEKHTLKAKMKKEQEFALKRMGEEEGDSG